MAGVIIGPVSKLNVTTAIRGILNATISLDRELERLLCWVTRAKLKNPVKDGEAGRRLRFALLKRRNLDIFMENSLHRTQTNEGCTGLAVYSASSTGYS